MPIELEAKMAVLDHAPVRARLEELGAQRLGLVVEINDFFDTEDRALLAADQGLRVRDERDLEGGRHLARVTFKGPRQPGVLKQREELEAGVADPEAMAQILGRLGFVRALRFQKRRESFSLGGCTVALDELPRLGAFIEIEGPSEPAVMAVREQLGLAQTPLITASYVSMLVSRLEENGRTERDVRLDP